MADVIEFFPGALACEIPDEGTPAPDVAKILRDLADMADSGAFQSVAIVAVSSNGTKPLIDTAHLEVNPYVLLAGLDEIITVLRGINLETAEFTTKSPPPSGAA